MTQVFLGIIVVGIILAVKVILEGFQTVTGLNDKISGMQIATQNCKTLIAEEDAKLKETETHLQELRAEVEQLTQEEKDINSEIRNLHTELDGQTFRIDP